MSEEKKKAQEIVEMFSNVCDEDSDIRWGLSRTESIKCAKLHAEGLIKYLPSEAGNPPNLQRNEYNCEFWNGVLAELNKV